MSATTLADRRVFWRDHPAVAGTVLCLGLILLGTVLAPLLPVGPHYRPGSLSHRLLSWDGLWYRHVALAGYHWTADGTQLGHYEDPDFFPGWPLLERLWIFIAGPGAGGIILLSLATGMASIVSMARLAGRVLSDRRQIALAVIAYAVWSGAYCFATGYPTGLINIVAFEALIAYLDDRRWRAALLAGLGTGVAPTMVFLAAALCIDQGLAWLSRPSWRRVPGLIGYGFLSVWGLLGFMAYLGWQFGDPALFTKAQLAWGHPPPVLIRLLLVIAPPWYLLPGWEAFTALLHGTTAGTGEIIYQRVLGMMTMLLAFGIAWRLWRDRPAKHQAAGTGRGLAAMPRILLLDFAVTVLGYMWFLGTTSQNMTATPRLLYPAPLLFLALALLAVRRPRTGFAVYCLSALTLTIQIIFVVAGYVVI